MQKHEKNNDMALAISLGFICMVALAAIAVTPPHKRQEIATNIRTRLRARKLEEMNEEELRKEFERLSSAGKNCDSVLDEINRRRNPAPAAQPPASPAAATSAPNKPQIDPTCNSNPTHTPAPATHMPHPARPTVKTRLKKALRKIVFWKR